MLRSNWRIPRSPWFDTQFYDFAVVLLFFSFGKSLIKVAKRNLPMLFSVLHAAFLSFFPFVLPVSFKSSGCLEPSTLIFSGS